MGTHKQELLWTVPETRDSSRGRGPPAEEVEAQAEVVAVATAEGLTTTTTTKVIEDIARRSHLNRAPENPSNLLQAVTGKTGTRELALRTEWATGYTI